ncbi:MAG: hypothetical protein FWH20_10040, partial [Oscillospiraceae bacterium]|nr:hypothetical protein [Oscillospiraceae bacterium]
SHALNDFDFFNGGLRVYNFLLKQAYTSATVTNTLYLAFLNGYVFAAIFAFNGNCKHIIFPHKFFICRFLSTFFKL